MAGMGMSFLSLRTVRHGLAAGHPARYRGPAHHPSLVRDSSERKAFVAGGRGAEALPDRARRTAGQGMGLNDSVACEKINLYTESGMVLVTLPKVLTRFHRSIH